MLILYLLTLLSTKYWQEKDLLVSITTSVENMGVFQSLDGGLESINVGSMGRSY